MYRSIFSWPRHGTSWRWMISFTSLPLYPRGNSPRYLLDRRLGGPQSRSGRRGEKKILDPTGTGVALPTTQPLLIMPGWSVWYCRRSYQTSLSRVDTPGLYMGSLGAKSRPGDRLSWLKVLIVFLSPSRWMSEWWSKQAIFQQSRLRYSFNLY
jgi:hypothetical protein